MPARRWKGGVCLVIYPADVTEDGNGGGRQQLAARTNGTPIPKTLVRLLSLARAAVGAAGRAKLAKSGVLYLTPNLGSCARMHIWLKLSGRRVSERVGESDKEGDHYGERCGLGTWIGLQREFQNECNPIQWWSVGRCSRQYVVAASGP